MADEPASVNDDREAQVAGSYVLGVRLLASAAVLALFAGCSPTIYTPGPQGPPGLTVSEARRSLSETLRAAKSRDGGPFLETRVSEDGFSIRRLSKGEARERRYRFSELPALSVKESGKAFVVDLGPDDKEQVAWDSPGDARRFVDVLQALGYLTSSKPLFSDNQAFAEFREKAAEWRALRPKPEFPEGARRYKALAEEAAAIDDHDGAASFYEQGLAIHPLWPEGQYNAALLYGDSGMYAKAIGHMKRYLELAPNAPEAGAARIKMQDWEKKLGLD
jgi:tetratricopeptide (TPR) repeat protein